MSGLYKRTDWYIGDSDSPNIPGEENETKPPNKNRSERLKHKGEARRGTLTLLNADKLSDKARVK